MNNAEYRIYHESFMQNNHGSTPLHTFMCILLTVQCSLFCAVKPRKYGLTQYINEYFIIVLPTVMAHTIVHDYIYELNLCVFLWLLHEILNKIVWKDVHNAFKSKNCFTNDRIQSITCLRGLTYLITVICILAVDFKDFPRYLAKTETYGYSLMDTGVGLFVLISGLVHKDFKNNYASVLKSNVKFIIILLTLGITRYLSIKQLDYQNHVTEYGVHWNFFYTLAVCKFLSTILLLLSPHSLLLSVLIIGIHEFLLYSGLETWVFGNTQRISLLDANKEGITSSLGYISLYLFAEHLKKELNNKSCNRYKILAKLVLSSFILAIFSYVIHLCRPTSRTLANTAYCTYLCAIIVCILSIMYFLEILFVDRENISFNVPLILTAINHNGLLFFLIANVTTGLINMSFRTLLLPSIATFIILNSYMIFTITCTVYINKKGIKL